ncbi:MAG: sulfatase-like hydrolase/transferase [Candidatus Marinimicrobia bacterium]|nr:sulfatase-like hydrolase/transferase [Candidatus Neomarinimicrobiota bacterium]
MTPNLLFLYTDEQRFDTLEAYGNDRIAMPNLNRLAEQACVVDQAYVTQPVCTPSRSSLLTGLYPHTNGCTTNNAPLDLEIPCLPEMLPAGRYTTAHFGKWHLGDELFAQHGFQHWLSIEDQYNQYFRPGRDKQAISDYSQWAMARGHQPHNGRTFARGEAARLPEASSKPAFLAEQAARFIRENQTNPFCLYVNFLEPHMPFFGPRDDQYPPGDMPLPANFAHPPTEHNHLRPRLLQAAYATGKAFGCPTTDADAVRQLTARYWGLCSQVDTHCGTILQALEESGLWDNTIIVFTSDHGDMMGAHQLIAKTVMYEEAVRVPLLVKLPGQKQMRRLEGPVSQIDLVPTLLELMGATPPATLEGRSRAAVLAADGNRIEEDVLIEWNGWNNGLQGDDAQKLETPDYLLAIASPEQIVAAMADPLRTIISGNGRWKLNVSPNLGRHELYDLTADPAECQNVYGRADTQPVVAGLLGRLRAWQQRTGDPVAIPEL